MLFHRIHFLTDDTFRFFLHFYRRSPRLVDVFRWKISQLFDIASKILISILKIKDNKIKSFIVLAVSCGNV